MSKLIYIEKDKHNAIGICGDGYTGIAIQVIRLVDQLVPNNQEDKELVTIKSHQVIKQILIPTSKTFRDDVAKGVATAKEILAQIRNQDKEIDGLLNDYLSQNKNIND